MLSISNASKGTIKYQLYSHIVPNKYLIQESILPMYWFVDILCVTKINYHYFCSNSRQHLILSLTTEECRRAP